MPPDISKSKAVKESDKSNNDKFDISRAKVVEESNKSDKDSFDISRAKVVEDVKQLAPNKELSPNDLFQRIRSNLVSKATEPIGGVGQRIIGAVANPAGNIPSIALSAAGVPEENIYEAVLGGVGGVIGARIGKPNLGAGIGAGAGNLLKQTAQKLRGNGEDIDIGDAVLVGGAVAAGGKFLDTALKTVGLTANLIPERARAKFFDKALQAVSVGDKALKRNWNKMVNTLVDKFPNTRVDLTSALKDMKDQFNQIDETLLPQLKTAVRNNKTLSEMVAGTRKVSELTLKEAQEFKNAITSTTNTVIKKAIAGKTTPNERVLFQILDKIDDSMVRSFPDMLEVKRVYNKGRVAFERARPLVEPGTAVENAIFSRPSGFFGVGGTPFMGSTHGKLAFKDITSKTKPGEKMFKMAKLAHDVNRAADFVGRMSQIGVGYTVVNKLFGRGKGPSLEGG